MTKSAAFHNLGCKVNAYETEAMMQQLHDAGYRIVPFEDRADVYVINTCSVTNIADRKSRQMLHRAKKRNPEAIVIAVGCYVQTAAEKTHLAVDADILIGNDRKGKLLEILEEYLKDRENTNRAVSEHSSGRVEEIISMSRECSFEETPIRRSDSHTRAFLKVQDGCNQFCSYCIIPYARGRIRSRDPINVRDETERLADSGIREIVLTGIHLSSYGKDLAEGNDLLSLISMISEIPQISRIRLGSLEPGIVTEEFAAALAENPKICPHFHLSLQSGSDSVLKRMNRRYDTEEYRRRCRILRDAFELPAITTDVIVGFPQETDLEFEETVSFLKELSLAETHIFKYSKREGTVAARMNGQVREEIKAERSDVLIRLGKENSLRFIRQWYGKEAQVLFEESLLVNKQKYYTGYTREYIRVCTEAGPSELSLENQVFTGRLEKEEIEGMVNFRIASYRNIY